MSSAAEQLARNFDLRAFGKATDLKKRILFTLGALIVYRLGTYIPLPGIDPAAMKAAFDQNAAGILGMLDLFAGGSLQRMAIFALNIMPYISASIIIQLLTTVSPTLEQLKKEGEAGRKKINQYTRYLTVVLTTGQAYGLAIGLQSASGFGGAIINPGPMFIFTTVVTLVGGTMFLMWLGEQITARGVGNGISLIIFAGIVAELPTAISQMLSLSWQEDQFSGIFMLGLLILMIATIVIIVFVERAQRRLVIQYPKRQVGNRMFGGENSHLPLKLNTAGVIPPIFASSLLMMPLTVAGFMQDTGPEWLVWVTANLGPGQPLYLGLYIAMIMFFAFFYTAIVFNPADTADNLKKHGGYIPGIRPGERTAEYIDFVLTRLTTVGAIYLALVCLMPELLRAEFAVPFYFGGTSLLIVVNVTMDTVTQIHSHLLAHQYEGLIQKSNLRGGGRKAGKATGRGRGRRK